MVPEALETCVDFLRFAFDPRNKSSLRECAIEYEQTIPFVSFVHACTDVQKVQIAIAHDSVLLIKCLNEECKVTVGGGFRMAATAGSLSCLKYFIDADCPGLIKQYDEVLKSASKEGHLHIIEYLWVEHGSLRTNQSEQHAVHGAAEQGHISILEFARTQSFSYFDTPTSFNELRYRPHVHTLSYLYEVGQVPDMVVLSDAVNNRNIDAAVLLREHGCPWDYRTCRDAAQRGHLDCLQYAYEQRCPWSDSIAADAAEATTVHCLQFVLERGAALTADTFLHAAKRAELSVFEYLLALHCPCDAHTCAALTSASKSFQTTFPDRWKCLRLLHESGCAWDERTCAGAAGSGDLDSLQYAYEHGCPWNATTCKGAAECGHLGCLRYAHENGCPWEPQIVCKLAAAAGNLECLQYLHEQSCAWDASICSAAARRGSLECLQYAHEHGCPWDPMTCCEANTRCCYEYAVARGCPGAVGNYKFYHLYTHN